MSKKTITISVEITEKQSLLWFIDAIRHDARESEWKTRTLYDALGHLVGVTVDEAVKSANKLALREKRPQINTTEFRKWFAVMFSELAGRVFLEDEK